MYFFGSGGSVESPIITTTVGLVLVTRLLVPHQNGIPGAEYFEVMEIIGNGRVSSEMILAKAWITGLVLAAVSAEDYTFNLQIDL